MHLWVRIETDAGITGLGECVHGGHQAIAIIQASSASKLIGRDPFAIDAIFEELRRSLVFEGGFAGALITALTGIEIALWDLKGKALKVPIYELLGGKFRDDIRVYCDCEVSPGMNMGEVQAVVDEVLEAGFTALKVDLDIRAYGHTGSETGWYEKDKFNMTPNKWEHDRMVQLAEMVVKAAGTVGRCRRRSPYPPRQAQRHPPRPRPRAAEADVARRAGAAREHRRHGRDHALRPRPRSAPARTSICATASASCSRSRPSTSSCPTSRNAAGSRECRKIAEMADLYSIPFAPHNVSSPIGTMASAHVCATVPNFLVLEFHWFHRDYWSTITDGGEIIKNGKIALSDRPGIGLELNEEVAKAHQYPGTTWFE